MFIDPTAPNQEVGDVAVELISEICDVVNMSVNGTNTVNKARSALRWSFFVVLFIVQILQSVWMECVGLLTLFPHSSQIT